MGLEALGGMPQELNRVPNAAPTLNAEAYEKLPIAEALSRVLSPAEAAKFKKMSEAASRSELEAAIADFNAVAEPKNASEVGLSLDDMLIPEQPIVLASDLNTEGATVLVSRTTRGVTSFRIAEVVQ